MFNAMSLTALRQLMSRALTNPFPAKRIPDDLTGALAAAAEGKIALNPPVPTYGRFRGKVDYNRAKCIGCGMCMKVCPANAITRDPDEPKKLIFHADRCCFCAQCNDICPVNALSMSENFAFATTGGAENRKASTAEKDAGNPTRRPFQAEWTDKPIPEYLPPERTETGPSGTGTGENGNRTAESNNGTSAPDNGNGQGNNGTAQNNNGTATPEAHPAREIDPTKCAGCTLCAKACPTNAITGALKHPHAIDKQKCVNCGACEAKCPKGAIREV